MRLTLKEPVTSLAQIAVVGLIIWLPLTWLLGGQNPLLLFFKLKGLAAALMFFCGAVIANATAVGGGMIFNPTLQLVFGVHGLAALSLAVLVQCAGMASGSFGWYRKGELANLPRTQLASLIGVTITTVIVANSLFIMLLSFYPQLMPRCMKIMAMLISFYVAYVVFFHTGSKTPATKQYLVLDWRIYPWLVLGTVINVATSVGSGMLTFSHLMKYYAAAPRTAVAVGTLMQAVAVWVQAGFILYYFRDVLQVDLLIIGLLCAMAGGRLAPWLLTRPLIEPHAKSLLVLAAISMGLVSAIMLFA